MPQLEEALFGYLSATPGLSALVGNRIYPLRGPEGVKLPYVTFRRVSSQRIYTHDSFADTDPYVRARVQLDCWAHTAKDAITVGEGVMLALSGYEGEMAGQPIGAAFSVSELDDYETGTKLYRRSLDFFIFYEDALA